MSLATVILIGMFGLLEFAHDVAPAADASRAAKAVVETGNRVIPWFSGVTVALYVWCLIAGTEVVTASFKNDADGVDLRYSAPIVVLQAMVILVGFIAGITIVLRAIPN